MSKNLELSNNFNFFPSDLRFYTDAPNNLITVYAGTYSNQAKKIIQGDIIGYLRIENHHITTFNQNMIENTETRQILKFTKNGSFRETLNLGIWEKYTKNKNTKDPYAIVISHKLFIQQYHMIKKDWISTYNGFYSTHYKSGESLMILRKDYEENFPAIFSDLYCQDKKSPSHLPSHILDIIKNNEGRENLNSQNLFLIDQYLNLQFMCEKKTSYPIEILVCEDKIINTSENYQNDEFQKIFLKHAGTTAHEKMDIQHQFETEDSTKKIFENFIIRSRKIINEKTKP